MARIITPLVAENVYDAGLRRGAMQVREDIAETLADLAAAHGELHAAWTAAARVSHEQRVAQRIAEADQCAARVNTELGRPPGYQYRGGPVDWHTGMPAGSACAWVRASRTPAATALLEVAA